MPSGSCTLYGCLHTINCRFGVDGRRKWPVEPVSKIELWSECVVSKMALSAVAALMRVSCQVLASSGKGPETLFETVEF